MVDNSRLFQKKSIVGKGSFGICLLVIHRQTKEEYIEKIIDTSKMNKKQRRDTMNEVHVLSRLSHPFIVKYQDSFIDKNNNLCIIMDYCNRGDLYTLIQTHKKKKSPIPEASCLRWFTQVTLALKHIHDMHILHRDLKTQNIFLHYTSGSGIEPRAKLGDFGISRVLSHTLDVAKTAIGTPYYLSPEICMEKAYGYKSDIWSLGCVLYEMCTLEHAFDSTSMKGLVLKILSGKYPKIDATKYSKNCDGLIASMLQINPDRRPSTGNIINLNFIQEVIKVLLKEEPKQTVDQSVSTNNNNMPNNKPSVDNDNKPDNPIVNPPNNNIRREYILNRKISENARQRAQQDLYGVIYESPGSPTHAPNQHRKPPAVMEYPPPIPKRPVKTKPVYNQRNKPNKKDVPHDEPHNKPSKRDVPVEIVQRRTSSESEVDSQGSPNNEPHNKSSKRDVPVEIVQRRTSSESEVDSQVSPNKEPHKKPSKRDVPVEIFEDRHSKQKRNNLARRSESIDSSTSNESLVNTPVVGNKLNQSIFCMELKDLNYDVYKCDSLEYKIEVLRDYLESIMGADTLLEIYTKLRLDEESLTFNESYSSYLPAVIQLIACEDYLGVGS